MAEIFKLSERLTTHKGSITELTLNMPRARLFSRFGMPFTSVREGDVDNPRIDFRFMPRIMFQFISDMSGVEEVTLEAIDARDVLPLFWKVVEMLTDRPQISST